MDKRTGWIYGLYDSENPTRVRYVGKTVSRLGVAGRVYQHKWAATKRALRVPSADWIRKIGPDRLSFLVLEEPPCREVDAREVHWIQEFRNRGMADLNILDGGDGVDAGYFSGEGNPKSALTWEIVRELRHRASKEYVSTTEEAVKYGVTPAALSKVLRNYSWYDPEYDPQGRKGVEFANSRPDRSGLVWRTVSDTEVEEMRRLYLTGRTIEEVMQSTGRPSTTVRRCLFEKYGSEESRRACVEARGPVQVRKPPVSASKRRDAVQRYHAGEGQAVLAKEFGVTQSAISYWVSRDKMETP